MIVIMIVIMIMISLNTTSYKEPRLKVDWLLGSMFTFSLDRALKPLSFEIDTF